MRRFITDTIRTALLITLVVTALAQSSNIALAQEARDVQEVREDTGFFLGMNVGLAGSRFEYKDGSRRIHEEATTGAMGGFRFGYRATRSLAVSLEAHGFGGTRDRDEDWTVGAAVVAVTWYPRGGGFYLRGGLGAGGGEFIHPDTDRKISTEERLAWMFGIGYDWRLSESFSLGLALEGFDMSIGDTVDLDENDIGAGGLTMQFTWHL
jgi:opacity protein-like surface antigen